MSDKPQVRWSQFANHIKGEHLNGKAWTVTIRAVEVEELHPRPGVAVITPVLYFQETKRGLPLSPTNQATLARLFGDDASKCIGQKVILRTVPMKVAGQQRLPIRIFAATDKEA